MKGAAVFARSGAKIFHPRTREIANRWTFLRSGQTVLPFAWRRSVVRISPSRPLALCCTAPPPITSKRYVSDCQLDRVWFNRAHPEHLLHRTLGKTNLSTRAP